MDQNLCYLKEAKISNLQETGAIPTDKLISGLQECSSVEYKLEKTLNQNEKFQINSLAITQQLHNSQRIQGNSDSAQNKMQIEFPATENIKVEVKQKKRKKIIPFDSLFKNYHQYACDPRLIRKPVTFVQYATNRKNVFLNSQIFKTDLGLYNMREIVQFCYSKKILSPEVYAQYSFQPCFVQEENFIDKLNRKEYEKIEFEKMYFTPIDHRFLCDILSSLFPEEFLYPAQVTMENKKLTTFYSYLYTLSNQEYEKLISNLNNRYNRAWMPKFGIEFQPLKNKGNESKSEKLLNEAVIFDNPPRKLRKKY